MFKKLIQWLANTQIQSAYRKGIAEGYQKKTDQLEQDKEISDGFLLQSTIGKKIISCSNEWQDPSFCIVKKIIHITQSRRPALECLNVLTNEYNIVLLNTFFIADEKMVDAILKLNPFERWNLSVGKKVHMSNMWEKGYPLNEITPPEVLKQQLIKVGFI